MDPISPHHRAVGLAIRHFRANLGISQESLAAKCDLDRSFMGGIERGERNFSFAKLVTICTGLEIPPSELLTEYERQLKLIGAT
jgi:transcriptional regulator with XRE-family HTH domain